MYFRHIKIYHILYIITLALVLQGCGQKGALFLPKTPSAPPINIPDNPIDG